MVAYRQRCNCPTAWDDTASASQPLTSGMLVTKCCAFSERSSSTENRTYTFDVEEMNTQISLLMKVYI